MCGRRTIDHAGEPLAAVGGGCGMAEAVQAPLDEHCGLDFHGARIAEPKGARPGSAGTVPVSAARSAETKAGSASCLSGKTTSAGRDTLPSSSDKASGAVVCTFLPTAHG